MIVIDTSVAVKWTVKEDGRVAAVALVDVDEARIAPDLLLPELVYVLRRKAIRGEIAPEQLGDAVAAVKEAIGQFVPSIQLVDDAIALSVEFNHSTYDCFLLALAIGRGVLISADEVFVRKCEASGYGAFVMLLRDVDGDRLASLMAFAALDAETLAIIKRLTPKIDATFKALPDAAIAAAPGR